MTLKLHATKEVFGETIDAILVFERGEDDVLLAYIATILELDLGFKTEIFQPNLETIIDSPLEPEPQPNPSIDFRKPSPSEIYAANSPALRQQKALHQQIMADITSNSPDLRQKKAKFVPLEDATRFNRSQISSQIKSTSPKLPEPPHPASPPLLMSSWDFIERSYDDVSDHTAGNSYSERLMIAQLDMMRALYQQQAELTGTTGRMAKPIPAKPYKTAKTADDFLDDRLDNDTL